MSSFDVVGFGALNVDKLFKVNRLAKAEEDWLEASAAYEDAAALPG